MSGEPRQAAAFPREPTREFQELPIGTDGVSAGFSRQDELSSTPPSRAFHLSKLAGQIFRPHLASLRQISPQDLALGRGGGLPAVSRVRTWAGRKLDRALILGVLAVGLIIPDLKLRLV